MQPELGVELPPHYYRDNFLSLCDTVHDLYGDLLLEPEIGLLEAFRELPFSAQCLYVRLVSRVGPWFRTDKLDYPEIDDLPGTLGALESAGLLLYPSQLPLEDLGKLYTRGELITAFGGDFPGPKPANKQALLGAMGELSLEPAIILQKLGSRFTGRVVAPRGLEVVQLLQLLFFGNRYQSLTEFVLSDLGVARFYPYALDTGTRLFSSREAVNEYLACAALSDRHRELLEADDSEHLVALASEMLELTICFSSSKRRWFRQCNALARDLERRGEDELAQSLYMFSERHPARERRARIMERRGDLLGAQALCQQILATPWGEEEAEAAGRILPRVNRKLGSGPVPRRTEQFARMDLTLPNGGAGVEERVALALESQWQSVHYVENTLMTTLFGLAFWEQIFAPVPGVFHNPFQSVPSDMYEPGFRARRGERLQSRMAELATLDLPQELVAAYRRYHPYQCRWVNWRVIDEDLVRRSTQLIPREHLFAIWERILFDPREYRRGFPDLLALGEQPGEYCLVEVKGPGDALQDSQKRWLRYFEQHGIPSSVAWVEWAHA